MNHFHRQLLVRGGQNFVVAVGSRKVFGFKARRNEREEAKEVVAGMPRDQREASRTAIAGMGISKLHIHSTTTKPHRTSAPGHTSAVGGHWRTAYSQLFSSDKRAVESDHGSAY